MNRLNVELDVNDADSQQELTEMAALTADQLSLIAGGECVVNSI